MKLKKTLFTTEMEITPEELRDFRFIAPAHMSIGLFVWIKEKFGVNMLPRPKKEEDNATE